MAARRAWLLLAFLLGGCDTSPERVPGSVPPGSISTVTQEISGSGDDALAHLGVLPLHGNPPTAIPLIHPPQVILFYCFPRKSRDGLAWRNGVWIARVITPFSWGVDDAMRGNSLRLAEMSSLHLDSQGQLVSAAASDPVPSAALDGLGGLAQSMPWRPTTEAATTRTTVIYPATGAAVTTQSSGSSPYLQANGSVNLQEVQRAMAAASQRLRDSQLAHGHAVPGSPVGVGTPAGSMDSAPGAPGAPGVPAEAGN